MSLLNVGKLTRSGLLTTVAIGTLLSAPAIAQTESDEETRSLNTVVVTAQRRSENQQETPVSVSTVSEEFLIDNDVRTLEDLTGAVPGFVATNSVNYGSAPLAIRGVGGPNGGANLFNDEPVGVYLDGVYIGRLSFSTADLVDLENAQVLRGPQGTLFGRNATAGALIVTTASPTDTFEGFAKASYNSLDEYRLAAAVSGPLIQDTLSGRLAIGWSDREGFGDNLATGNSIGGSEDFTARGRLTFTPTDRLTANFIVEYQDRQAEPATLQLADLFSGPSNPLIVRPGLQEIIESNTFNLDAENFFESESLTTSLAINYDLGWAEIDSISAFRYYDFNGAQDSDGTELNLFNNLGSADNEQYTQELRLSSKFDGPFSFIGGVFYIHEDNALSPFVINNVPGLFGLGTRAAFDSFQNLDSVSVFLDGTYELTDRLSITAGLRYTHEVKDFNTNFELTILNGGTVPPIPPAGPLGGATLPAGTPFPPGSPAGGVPFADSATFDDVSPRVVVDYKISDDIFVYASYSQGFKSGGFNSFGLTPAFAPEEIDAFEGGIKSEWFNNRLRANLAGFYYDYSDLQVRVGVPTGGVNIQNAAGAEVQGGELELSAVPIDGLTLTANFAYLDAEFTEGTLPAVPADQLFFIGAPVTLADQDISGNSLSRAPDWQVYLAAGYEFAISQIGSLALQANWRYQSETFFLEVNQGNNTFRVDDFNELGLRATLTTLNDRVDISIFGQNITNERYVTQVTQLGSFPNGAVNEPRKWGGEVKVRF